MSHLDEVIQTVGMDELGFSFLFVVTDLVDFLILDGSGAILLLNR